MPHRDVYFAIADPTRRDILDLLNDRDVVAAGEIAAEFRSVSRPAVSRHLRILRECGVVHCISSGKTKNYALNPGPINEVRQGWLNGFAKKQMKSLTTLREIVETNG